MSFCCLRLIVLGFLVLFAAACGGGGGGGSDTTPTPAPSNPPANAAPVVSAGVDQTVDEADNVQLSGTATDSDGTIASTLWTQVMGPTVSLTDRSRLSPSFTAPDVDSETALEFQLAATDDDGATASDRVRILVTDVPVEPPPPPSISLTAAPEAVAPGDTSVLTWTSERASSCEASGGWTGSRGPHGSEVVTPTAPATAYGLTCSGSGGSAESSVSVAVIVSRPTLTFTASPTAVRSGTSSILTWSSTGALSCSASGAWSGTRPVSGTERTSPLTTPATFALTCEGPGGQTSETLTVSINSLEGSLLLSPISQSDNDVNDPSAPYTDNGSLLNAQPLPNPVILGGYVNEAERGPEGRSFATGDLDDIYSVSLAAGQVVELILPSADASLPDSERDDADLGLYDQDGNLVDESIGLGQIERLTVPATGDYYVRVSAYSGAPLYRLSVGQSGVAAASVEAPRLSDAFVPGEIIMLHPSSAEGKTAGSGRLGRLERGYGMRRKAGASDREVLLAIPASASQRQAVVEKPLRGATRARGLSVPTQLVSKWETLRYLKRLRADPLTGPVALNRIVRTSAVPNDPLYPTQQWHYSMIQLEGARDLVIGDPSIVVAIVDSGIFANHPDLAANIFDGYDFVSNTSNGDGDGIDPDPDDPGCVLGGTSIFHGTHVAGTVSAATDNSDGVAGIAGNVLLMPLRVLDGCQGTGSLYDVIQGVRYAAGLENDSGMLPARRADVINMSLGAAGTCNSSLAQFFETIRAQGVSVVAAAGNDGTSTTFVPASCPTVVSVSAVGPTRDRAFYSNFGESWVDVAAPGGDIRLDVNGDGTADGVLSTDAIGGGDSRRPAYSVRQGTSMAAPHVAGVLALMKAANPLLTPAEIELLLAHGLLTDDISAPGPDSLGVGLINAFKAVRAAGGDIPQLPPKLTVSPTSLNFGDVGTRAEVVAANGGTGALELSQVTTSAAWIRVVPLGTGEDGLGPYEISVNRTGLETGLYEGWIDFVSSENTVRVPVLMQVAGSAGEPDSGLQYILVIDPDRFSTIEQLSVLAVGDSVDYRFDSLDSGGYFVVSGTDMNNDFLICDDGEACGIYPVESDPVEVQVTGPASGIDFASTFRTSVDAGATNKRAPATRSNGFKRLQ